MLVCLVLGEIWYDMVERTDGGGELLREGQGLCMYIPEKVGTMHAPYLILRYFRCD